MAIIKFYRVSDEFGAFSNFAPYPIEIGGTLWPTTEHYYQASKVVDADLRERIRSEPSPMKAARMGRSRRNHVRRDWESIKESIMYDALKAKFVQHASLRDLLLSTGESIIVEHSSNDSYWADGGDGSGKNRLGAILMEVRDELRSMMLGKTRDIHDKGRAGAHSAGEAGKQGHP